MLDEWLAQQIEQKKEEGLYRVLKTTDRSPSMQNNNRMLVFSSNHYLGIGNDDRLKAKAVEVLQDYSIGSSGSRLTTGNTAWHEKLEKKLANFKRAEAALLFSSGYLANIGVLTSLPQKGDVLFSDELNHASIIDGCRLSKANTIIYPHLDMNQLQEKLRVAKSYRRRFIVTDGVFSMDGTIAPLDKIMQIAKEHNAYVIVDDAHATGVLGVNGRGTSEYFQVQPDVVIGTLSKSVGTEGGFVVGSKILIDYLCNHARTFIFQTAMPPSICAASYVALEIIEKSHYARKHLLTLTQRINTDLKKMGYRTRGNQTPIIPVIIGDEKKAIIFSQRLEEEGIFAPAIRPPTVPIGESRIRLTVNANHSEEDVEILLAAFRKIGQELKLIS